MSTRPPERTCTSCGQMCRSKNQVCMACSTGHTSRYADGESVALTGGSWQPVRGVLRWVPEVDMTLDELAELREKMHPKSPETVPVACSRCGALVTEKCRTRNGHRTSDHRERALPRICKCGADLKPRCHLCETCARVATAEQKARWHERNRERDAA